MEDVFKIVSQSLDISVKNRSLVTFTFGGTETVSPIMFLDIFLGKRGKQLKLKVTIMMEIPIEKKGF